MEKEIKINSDLILEWAKSKVESKEDISRELWLDMAFKLNLLRLGEGYWCKARGLCADGRHPNFKKNSQEE